MSRQLTVRRVPDEIADKLTELSRSRRQSVNTTMLEILQAALGATERRRRLERYATWEERDAEEFEAALRAQRVIDAELWD